MKPAPEDYPFLFVHHGAPDASAVGRREEVFLWFRAPVSGADRARIMAAVPTPLQRVWHWDREFCYFGSDGDSYEFAVLLDYTPEPVRAALHAADPARDPKAWHRAFRHATARLDEALAAFSDDLDRWLLGVHAIAPIALFWGPGGTPDDDPWHRWSVDAFADVMGERLSHHAPTPEGERHLGWIRDRCAPLLAAPGADDAPSLATLDEACRRGRPRQFVPRLSYDEGEVLRHGELVACFVGDGPDWSARLERLAPLTQLTFLASYDVDHARLAQAYPSLPERLRALVEGLAPDERRSALPLLVMLSQTLTRDTPAFDHLHRHAGELAAQVLRVGFDQPGCRGATFARASRYLRWARRLKEARALAEEGLFRYGERRSLVRAALKAARAMGDDKAARKYEARLTALTPAS
ncbi:MAG: hypothetical protein Q8S73_14420 [Deltaproteobacteria bacterium]|nr:hypothetical protein [Myxococcales bacterium]MDP3215298.1 hypothetical protein [Deltaproteobacteria bacterium]